jgi:lysine/ornithine N-monooxygenase
LQVVWLLLIALALFCCIAYLATDGEHWLESTFSSLFQDRSLVVAVGPSPHIPTFGREVQVDEMTECKWSRLEESVT